ncbi:hypothetical protein T12_12510, partial [Trichinella patagoniensis]
MESKTWLALLEDFLRLNCVSPSEWAKREAGRKGSNTGGRQAEMTARGYPPVDTGSSSLSDECANSAIADNTAYFDPSLIVWLSRQHEPEELEKSMNDVGLPVAVLIQQNWTR